MPIRPSFIAAAVPAFAALIAAAPATAQFATDPDFELTFGLSSDETLYQRELYGFYGTGAFSLAVSGRTGPVDYRLQLGLQDDDGVWLDGSYIQYDAGNWVYGFGAIERIWGPSRSTSILLSRNARPHPTFYISRQEPRAFASPFLSWIGPWDAELFVGQLEGDRAVPDTRTFGMRVGVEPLPGFVIDLERTAQWGGEGRPNDFGAFFDVLIGETNQEDAEDAANQLAGVSFSYSLPDAVAPLRVYAQFIGEDEGANLPSKYMYLAGAETDAALFGVPSVLTLEVIDTRIDALGGGSFPNVAYQNRFYPDGYTYDGRVLGAAIDTDGLSVRLSGSHTIGNVGFDWGLAQVRVNDTDKSVNRLSSTAVSGLVADLGASYTLRDGTELSGGIAYQGFALDNADIPEGVSATAMVSRRF